ncbi:MAG TPA: hypothetical protein VJJ46_06620 [Anaerolineales bacterium]|nr:hypothetical protein [Anaerolineales bacterium]
MSVLRRLASAKARRDEAPNKELAKDLARRKDRAAIGELAANLKSPDPDIQSDCVKVLYETGFLDPELIADYAGEFLGLLGSQNNRMVRGGMIALACIAPLRAALLYANIETIKAAMRSGSVITIDNAVKVIAGVAAAKKAYSASLFPILLTHLRTCRPKEIPQHAESALPAVNRDNQEEFLAVLRGRAGDLTPSQAARVQRIIRRLEKG